jgi:hypothetical protein
VGAVHDGDETDRSNGKGGQDSLRETGAPRQVGVPHRGGKTEARVLKNVPESETGDPVQDELFISASKVDTYGHQDNE